MGSCSMANLSRRHRSFSWMETLLNFRIPLVCYQYRFCCNCSSMFRFHSLYLHLFMDRLCRKAISLRADTTIASSTQGEYLVISMVHHLEITVETALENWTLYSYLSMLRNWIVCHSTPSLGFRKPKTGCVQEHSNEEG